MQCTSPRIEREPNANQTRTEREPNANEHDLAYGNKVNVLIASEDVTTLIFCSLAFLTSFEIFYLCLLDDDQTVD